MKNLFVDAWDYALRMVESGSTEGCVMFAFDPHEDITAYELAMILAITDMKMGLHVRMADLDTFALTPYARHFRKVPN